MQNSVATKVSNAFEAKYQKREDICVYEDFSKPAVAIRKQKLGESQNNKAAR